MTEATEKRLLEILQGIWEELIKLNEKFENGSIG